MTQEDKVENDKKEEEKEESQDEEKTVIEDSGPNEDDYIEIKINKVDKSSIFSSKPDNNEKRKWIF